MDREMDFYTVDGKRVLILDVKLHLEMVVGCRKVNSF